MVVLVLLVFFVVVKVFFKLIFFRVGGFGFGCLVKIVFKCLLVLINVWLYFVLFLRGIVRVFCSKLFIILLVNRDFVVFF